MGSSGIVGGAVEYQIQSEIFHFYNVALNRSYVTRRFFSHLCKFQVDYILQIAKAFSSIDNELISGIIIFRVRIVALESIFRFRRNNISSFFFNDNGNFPFAKWSEKANMNGIAIDEILILELFIN